MKILQPDGPFLVLRYNPVTGLCRVDGTIENRDLAFDILRKAEKTLRDYYEKKHAEDVVNRTAITLTDA